MRRAIFLNVNNAFIERTDGSFEWFGKKLEQFGVKVYTQSDFPNLFDINNEIQKAGGSDFLGLDLVVVDLEARNHKLEEPRILNSIEPWKYSLIYTFAKNYRNSVVLVDSDDYERVLESLDECGDVTLRDRRMFALKALYRLLRINSIVHKEMSELFAAEKFETLILEEITPLRYGENPHQLSYIAKIAKEKAFFDFADEDELFGLSYNNIVDMHLALTAVKYLGKEFAVHVHHGIIVDARTKNFDFKGARGVVAAGFASGELLEGLDGNDLDILIVPGKIDGVRVRKLLSFDDFGFQGVEKEYRFFDGNILVQTPDDISTMRFLSEVNDSQYRMANTIVALSRSMACCIFKDYELLALGSGQSEQIDALDIAVRRAERRNREVKDAIFAFDGPIRDFRVIDLLIEAGAGTVIEPGGVKEDREIREKLENAGIKFILSGKRRYRH